MLIIKWNKLKKRGDNKIHRNDIKNDKFTLFYLYIRKMYSAFKCTTLMNLKIKRASHESAVLFANF